jgi:hypothetical protein
MTKIELKDDLKIIIITGAAFASSYAVKRLTEKVWLKIMHEEAPKNPAHPSVTWGDAIFWAAFTGAVAGTMKLLVKKGAKIQLDKLF